MRKRSIQIFALATVVAISTAVHAQKPITKLADRSKRGILSYFKTIVKNNQVIVGQQCSETPDIALEYKKNFQRLYDSSGKYPALIGLEYGYFSNVNYDETNRFAISHWQKGGLVTIDWSADNPFTDGYDVRWNSIDKKDSIDVKRLLKNAPVSKDKTSDRNELYKIANALKQLKDAGVTVLWRPFHEINGNWFWWCANNLKMPTNKDDFQALWKDMYETFTNDFDLDNLLWVYAPFSPQGTLASVEALYPESKYVDIVALDIYPKTPQFADYNDLKNLGKLVTNGEIGPAKESYGSFDEMEVLKILKGKAPYFLQWHSWTNAKVGIVDNARYKQVMNDPSAITLDKIGKQQ